MKKRIFEISFVRIEHHVYNFEVEVEHDDEDEAYELAKEKAEKYIDSDEFDWDSFDTVHAEEFINDIDEV